MIDNKRFGEYLENLPISQHGKIIKLIAKACKVNRQVVYNWKYGTCHIPAEQYGRIEKIIGENIFS